MSLFGEGEMIAGGLLLSGEDTNRIQNKYPQIVNILIRSHKLLTIKSSYYMLIYIAYVFS